MKLVQIPEETAMILHAAVVDAITTVKDKELAARSIVAAGVLAQAMANPVKRSGRPKKTDSMISISKEEAEKLYPKDSEEMKDWKPMFPLKAGDDFVYLGIRYIVDDDGVAREVSE